MNRRRSGAGRIGLWLLVAFFAFGTLMAAASAVALLFPGGALDPFWRLNPRAHRDFLAMDGWAPPLMFAVALACGLAAVGLWSRARWGHRLAVAMLALNLVGDAGNALIRGDLRTLIGLPIGGLMIAYLLRAGVRARFGQRPKGLGST
jgi:hypothetical protein